MMKKSLFVEVENDRRWKFCRNILYTSYVQEKAVFLDFNNNVEGRNNHIRNVLKPKIYRSDETLRSLKPKQSESCSDNPAVKEFLLSGGTVTLRMNAS